MLPGCGCLPQLQRSWLPGPLQFCLALGWLLPLLLWSCGRQQRHKLVSWRVVGRCSLAGALAGLGGARGRRAAQVSPPLPLPVVGAAAPPAAANQASRRAVAGRCGRRPPYRCWCGLLSRANPAPVVCRRRRPPLLCRSRPPAAAHPVAAAGLLGACCAAHTCAEPGLPGVPCPARHAALRSTLVNHSRQAGGTRAGGWSWASGWRGGLLLRRVPLWHSPALQLPQRLACSSWVGCRVAFAARVCGIVQSLCVLHNRCCPAAPAAPSLLRSGPPTCAPARRLLPIAAGCNLSSLAAFNRLFPRSCCCCCSALPCPARRCLLALPPLLAAALPLLAL